MSIDCSLLLQHSDLCNMHFAQVLIMLTLQHITINAVLKHDNPKMNYATSVVSMFPLLYKERKYLKNLNEYVNSLEHKLKLVRAGLAQMQHFDLAPGESAETQLTNPVRNFALMRHMSIDWLKWHELMQKRPEEKQIEYLRKNRDFLPTKGDVEEAALGLLRMQKFYNITINDTVRGLFKGRQYSVSLNGLDCYNIGLVNYEADDFIGAIEWFDNAHGHFMRHNMTNYRQLKDIFHYKASTLWHLNRRADMLQLLDEALIIWPHDVYFQKKRSKLLTSTMPYLELKEKSALPEHISDADKYCTVDMQPSVTSLHCRYNNTNNDFLKLAPLKMEELNLSPYVVLFHDVLYNSEIVELTGTAKPHMKRARFAPENETDHFSNVRTTHVIWLKDDVSPTTSRINRRISDMSRFKLESSEMLQVMNYGIGGHYYTHIDAFNSTKTPYGDNDDRIATVLFYLSDVTQGGSTRFPFIPLIIEPKKGAAILWYNLENSGVAEQKSAHVACPVIVGSKWVMSKWIHENSQMFIKPCLRETQS